MNHLPCSDNLCLEWKNGSVHVQPTGGMLTNLTFTLADGEIVKPLYRAPWHGESGPGLDDNPLLRALTGEWICAPYGPAAPPPSLPEGWTARITGPDDPDSGCDHGWAANHAWHVEKQDDAELLCTIDLPETHDLHRIERLIRVLPDGYGLEILTTLFPRRDTLMPVALHPSFALPLDGMKLQPGPTEKIHTYPLSPVPGTSMLQPGAQAASLSAVPSIDGGTLDMTHLPLPKDTEELVQLEKCKPPFTLHTRSESARPAAIRIDWDAQILPDVLVWISQKGRTHAPWNGRNLAVGIEPCASCFDLTRVAEPAATHPLAKRKGIALQADVPLTIRWSLSVVS